MSLYSTVLNNTVSNIFVRNGENIVTTMYFCNSGNVTAYISVYAVPAGNIASANNAIYYTIPICHHDTYVVEHEKLALDNGDAICANITSPTVDANVRVVATVSSYGV